MISLLTDSREQIAALCRQHRVQRLDVFGSAAVGAFDPEGSDLDFLVEFLPLKRGEHADAYFGLLEGLQSLLGRPVDLVMTRAIKNPYFLQAVGGSREALYAA